MAFVHKCVQNLETILIRVSSVRSIDCHSFVYSFISDTCKGVVYIKVTRPQLKFLDSI